LRRRKLVEHPLGKNRDMPLHHLPKNEPRLPVKNVSPRRRRSSALRLSPRR
jgi:hypothetical protein